MKSMKYVLNGFLALAMVLMFTQCTDNKSDNTANTPAIVSGPVNMKIAYVEIDSLLTKYRFWNDLNEIMIQKEENIRTTLNERAKELDAEMREFQRKLENNGFASRERAEQENLRISKKQRDLQQLQEKLKVSEWDLIVCDEAHKMSATVWGGEIKYTKRFQLGKLLSNITKNFLLLTATPHNGKDEDFHLFLS